MFYWNCKEKSEVPRILVFSSQISGMILMFKTLISQRDLVLVNNLVNK